MYEPKRDGWNKPQVLDCVKVITPDMAVKITPAMAAKLLALNKNFRKLREGVVSKYAGLMTNGKWELNGAPIIFNGDGSLSDGQHRLAACVKAGVPFMTFVIVGGTDLGIDEGASRTLSQWLSFDKVKNVSLAASVTRMIFVYKHTPEGVPWMDHTSVYHKGLVNIPKPSVQELREYYHLHARNIDTSVSICQHPQPSGLVQAGVLGGLHYLFAELDRGMAGMFVKTLYGQVSVPTDDPVLQLRTRLLRELPKTNAKSSARTRAALAIKAWNLWCRGDGVTRLRFVGSGPTAETFPEIESPQK